MSPIFVQILSISLCILQFFLWFKFDIELNYIFGFTQGILAGYCIGQIWPGKV